MVGGERWATNCGDAARRAHGDGQNSGRVRGEAKQRWTSFRKQSQYCYV